MSIAPNFAVTASHERRHVGGAREIAGKRTGLDACFAQLRHDLFGAVATLEVMHRDLCAALAERHRAGTTEAGTCAGDERHSFH